MSRKSKFKIRQFFVKEVFKAIFRSRKQEIIGSILEARMCVNLDTLIDDEKPIPCV